ncbi:cation diffusion facilitator family transporter [Uliginosibacterium sp. sgz301328]|uniref:cation diffusion facilitator family transporter n=1 Tax=Uliginosibacterium sp. sgz301328 TaxID=3243764 RepID=UPI00359EDB3E
MTAPSTATERANATTRYLWLSVIAAVATIALKFAAWWWSGSVGLLSDALESFVNLAGAAFALGMVSVARTPPDEDHPFGHNKAEYFSSGFEGTLIFAAAIAILVTAVPRLWNPPALESLDIGLIFSAISTALNFVVSRVLMNASRRLHSIVLEADARHLMTDVWTSIGVIAALFGVMATGWRWLDPVIAIAVALHIMVEGGKLMRASVNGLMDLALPAADIERIDAVLHDYAGHGVRFEHLKTRRAGSERFVNLNVLVPGDWRVDRSHQLLDEIEDSIARALGGAQVTTHLEPLPGH